MSKLDNSRVSIFSIHESGLYTVSPSLAQCVIGDVVPSISGYDDMCGECVSAAPRVPRLRTCQGRQPHARWPRETCRTHTYLPLGTWHTPLALPWPSDGPPHALLPALLAPSSCCPLPLNFRSCFQQRMHFSYFFSVIQMRRRPLYVLQGIITAGKKYPHRSLRLILRYIPVGLYVMYKD